MAVAVTLPTTLTTLPEIRSCKTPVDPGFMKKRSGWLEAPTLRSCAGVKVLVYFALAVIMGWNIKPMSLAALRDK